VLARNFRCALRIRTLFLAHHVGLLELLVDLLVDSVVALHVRLDLLRVGEVLAANLTLHSSASITRYEAPEPCGSSASTRKRAPDSRYRPRVRSQCGGRAVFLNEEVGM